MKLKTVVVEGYRSTRKSLTLHLDPRVTIFLGANDHGKTNLIEAIVHLNREEAFDESRDLNWDSGRNAESLPLVQFEFALDEDDRRWLSETENATRWMSVTGAAVDAAGEKLSEARSKNDEASVELEALKVDEQTAQEAADDVSAELERVRPEVDPSTGVETRSRLPALRRQRRDLSKTLSQVSARVLTATKKQLATSATFEDAEAELALAIENAAEARLVADGVPDVEAAEELLRKAEQRMTAASDEAEEAAAEAHAARSIEKETRPRTRAKPRARVTAEAAERIAASAALRATRSRSEARRAAEAVEAARKREKAGPAFRAVVDPTRVEIDMDALPEGVVARRRGVNGAIEFDEVEGVSTATLDRFLVERMPRVELIAPISSIPDSVSVEELETEQFEFMRGIFYYAGLDRDSWAGVFEQNDKTTRTLRDASERLNQELSRSWTQGAQLRFILQHGAEPGHIELRIADPAVDSQDVRASRRSSGFTHFFALKTILHARQVEAPASAYIWLFDEPGVFLHPDGQHDLMQVIEALSASSQIVYSTHSLFMVNKNHPTRHRLLTKSDAGGTKIDSKPFVGRWRPALDALGLGLPGTILFASKVLLVEGDSDPVYLYSLLQSVVEAGLIDIDLNPMSIMATGNSRHADALVQILREAAIKPEIAALYDNDGGGRNRLKALEKNYKIPGRLLRAKGETIEDYLPFAEELYPRAVGLHLASVPGTSNSVLADVEMHFEEARANGSVSLRAWSKSAGEALGGEDPSTVGIARQYQALLSERGIGSDEGESVEKALWVAKWIRDSLGLAKQASADDVLVAR